MAPRVHIETERLLLRDWTDADLAPFAALNADLRVMEFFVKPLDRTQSDGLAQRIRANLARDGWGLYSAEVKDNGAFIGFVGLAVPGFDAPFMPAIEIGWRLARTAWGGGYATEGARGVVDHAFGALGMTALVSFTAEWNRPSRRVMEKLGMTHDPRDDFINPRVPAGHKLAPHVLYRLDREGWHAGTALPRS
ncbi:GNAT family N-acetyltransferase [soil metagenome]